MEFQDFSKITSYFNGILTAFVTWFPVIPVTFCLNLNKALIRRKLSRVPGSVKASSSL